MEYAHINIDSKPYAKYQNPSLSGSQDIVLTTFSIVMMARAITLVKKTVKHNYGIIRSSSGHGNNNWKVSFKSNKNCKMSCINKTYS